MSVSSICKAALAAAALLSPQVFGAPAAPMSLATRGAENKFAFGSDKIRGVNLGGWFVLEPWITPSLFEECADDVVDGKLLPVFKISGSLTASQSGQ